ncbi:MAG: hypothetical protein AAB116_06785 [Candidatus Poribacteria bacterium]
MKQHRKRKDLERISVSIPKEIYDWIKIECQDNNESMSVVVSRLLETLYNLKKNLSLG